MAPCQSRSQPSGIEFGSSSRNIDLEYGHRVANCRHGQPRCNGQGPSPSISPETFELHTKTHFHEPEIKREMRCPTCLNKISCPKDQIILTCPWLPHPNARKPCGADLWKPLLNRKGEKVPACLVTTQTIQSMLPSFLSRKVIDDALHETHQKQDDNLDSGET